MAFLSQDLKMLNEWIEEVEQKMQNIESSGANGDFGEKRAALEKVKIINKDVAPHEEMIDRAKAKLQENNAQPTPEFEASLARFEGLKDKLKKNINVNKNFQGICKNINQIFRILRTLSTSMNCTARVTMMLSTG
jgi:hypothetical protein